eukprot:gene7019-biopygen7937
MKIISERPVHPLVFAARRLLEDPLDCPHPHGGVGAMVRPVAHGARDGAEEDAVRKVRDRRVCERGAESLRREALEGGRPATEGREDVEPTQLRHLPLYAGSHKGGPSGRECMRWPRPDHWSGSGMDSEGMRDRRWSAQLLRADVADHRPPARRADGDLARVGAERAGACGDGAHCRGGNVRVGPIPEHQEPDGSDISDPKSDSDSLGSDSDSLGSESDLTGSDRT